MNNFCINSEYEACYYIIIIFDLDCCSVTEDKSI